MGERCGDDGFGGGVDGMGRTEVNLDGARWMDWGGCSVVNVVVPIECTGWNGWRPNR